jgi:O-succinylbenzoate synthase
LYGKIVHRSIVKLIGGRTQMSEEGALNPIPDGYVEGGVVIGIQGTSATIAAVSAAVDAGYRRVKLKVKPKHDVDVVRAVRTKFPHLKIMLDANQSYNEDSRSDMNALREMDTMRITCLEEPLNAHYTPKSGPRALFDRLARLQQSLATPIALDESWTNVAELHDALTRPELRCVVVKAAKFGGVQTFLDEYKCMRRRGISMWMGGMFDTGVSKRLHAALATLPGIIIPGDINNVESCFGTDVTVPPCVPHNGVLRVNPQGHEYGLGCELDRDAIEHHSIEHHVFSASVD